MDTHPADPSILGTTKFLCDATPENPHCFGRALPWLGKSPGLVCSTCLPASSPLAVSPPPAPCGGCSSDQMDAKLEDLWAAPGGDSKEL